MMGCVLLRKWNEALTKKHVEVQVHFHPRSGLSHLSNVTLS